VTTTLTDGFLVAPATWLHTVAHWNNVA